MTKEKDDSRNYRLFSIILFACVLEYALSHRLPEATLMASRI